jgi:hypothetical protein
VSQNTGFGKALLLRCVGEQKELHVSSAEDQSSHDILVFYFSHITLNVVVVAVVLNLFVVAALVVLVTSFNILRLTKCFLLTNHILRPSCRLTSHIVVILRLLQQS